MPSGRRVQGRRSRSRATRPGGSALDAVAASWTMERRGRRLAYCSGLLDDGSRPDLRAIQACGPAYAGRPSQGRARRQRRASVGAQRRLWRGPGNGRASVCDSGKLSGTSSCRARSRPPGAGAGVRRKRERPEPTWLAAWRELKPQRRALSQAQAQIRGAGPAPSRRRPGNASAAQRPTPPRQLSRRDRSKLPHPSRPRQPARATAAPYRQARTTWPGPGTSRATPHEPGPANTGPQQLRGIPTQAQKAQNHCSARLTSYQAATRIRYSAPQNTRIYIRIMLLNWVELSGLEPLTSCMP